jgi:hypothetical protein
MSRERRTFALSREWQHSSFSFFPAVLMLSCAFPPGATLIELKYADKTCTAVTSSPLPPAAAIWRELDQNLPTTNNVAGRKEADFFLARQKCLDYQCGF